MDLIPYDLIGAPAQVTTQSKPITVPALIIVEGAIEKGPNGGRFTFARMEAIAKATNVYLESGEDAPLFLSNHNEGGQYSTGDIVGGLQIGLSVQKITAENLPNSGMTDLIGKWGLFGNIAITMDDGIIAYGGGIKKISMGIGSDDIIYEVSMVPWGAIRGASLYGKTFTPTTTTAGNLLIKGLSDEVKEAIAQYGLTIAQTRIDQNVSGQRSELLREFRLMLQTIDDIQASTDAALEGRSRDDLANAAIADFVGSMRSRLDINQQLSLFSSNEGIMDNDQTQPSDVQDAPATPELETHSEAPVDLSVYEEQLKDLTQKYTKLEERLTAETQRANEAEKRHNEAEKRQQITVRYGAVKGKAEGLVKEGRMTPVQYKDTFGDDPQVDIANYCNPPEGEVWNLALVEHTVEQVGKYNQPIAPKRTGAVSAPAEEEYKPSAELLAYRGFDPDFK